MNKIYLVIQKYTYEYNTNVFVDVYDTKEKAQSALEYIADRETLKSWICRKNDVQVERNENLFDAWVDGNASEFQTTISVQEKEIW